MNSFRTEFHDLPIWYLSICVVISTILGMSVHHFIVHILQQPPNYLSQAMGGYLLKFAIVLIHILQALATIILYALISRHWKLKSYWIQVLVFAVILAAINENLLRRFIMEILANKIEVSYEFILVAIPAYLSFALPALFIVTFFSYFKKIGWWKYIILFVLVFLSYQYVETFAHSTITALFPLKPGGITLGDYGFIVTIFIFATYLIPVASMCIAYLWSRKSFPKRGRGFLYFLLLVGVHGQLIGFFQMATSQGNLFYRILYYGSFLWELLIVTYTIVFLVERKLAR